MAVSNAAGTAGPASGAAQGAGLRPDDAAIAALYASPAFAAAVLHMEAGIENQFGGNRLLSRLMSDRGRALFATMVLALHSENEGGLTAAPLIAFAVSAGLASPGRAKAMLALLRWGGYLADGPATADRRQRPLVPTAKLWDSVVPRWRVLFEALAMLDRTGAAALAAVDGPVFRAAFLRALAAAFRAGYRPLDHAPRLREVVERDAGFALLLAVDLAARRQMPAPPIAALATRFGVSRAHVLEVLRGAEAAGLVVRGAGTGAATATPVLGENVERVFAAMLALAQMAAESGLDAQRETAPPGEAAPFGP